MIIGINGKIGCGKDTVGEIIRYLISYHIHGYPHGFDSNVQYRESHWKIKKFAGKLKQVASLLTGISVEKFEDQEFKKQFMGSEWDMTYRELLQKIGTEAMRDGLHKDVWVNALVADYIRPSHWENRYYDDVNKKGLAGREEVWGDFPNWCITDMRFPNEMKAVKDRNGITIRITRGTRTMVEMSKDHPSETALDRSKFDYELSNDSTIEELVKKVKDILINEKII
jgi:hypothetical protein